MGDPAHVMFYEVSTKKEGFIAYNIPPAPKFPNQTAFGRHYHYHPHPSFSASENYINFSATFGGEMNVYLAFTKDIFG